MTQAKTIVVPENIARVEARLFRLPVEPPRGDAIQRFEALELPLVQITDGAGRVGVGFGYTIGAGGRAILELLRHELIDWLREQDARRISFIHEYLHRSIHALTPGCISSAALAAIDIALWDIAGKRSQTPLYILLGGAQEKVLVAPQTFKHWFKQHQSPIANRQSAMQQVVLWADTFNNYFLPRTAQAAVEVLEAAGFSGHCSFATFVLWPAALRLRLATTRHSPIEANDRGTAAIHCRGLAGGRSRAKLCRRIPR